MQAHKITRYYFYMKKNEIQYTQIEVQKKCESKYHGKFPVTGNTYVQKGYQNLDPISQP